MVNNNKRYYFSFFQNTFLLILLLFVTSIFAQKKIEASKDSLNRSNDESNIKEIIIEVEQKEQNELEVFRKILNKPQATFRDMFDVYLMQNGHFAGMSKPVQRIKWMINQNFFPVSDRKQLDQKITRADLAKFLHQTGNYEKGMMYYITKNGHYAFRDITRLGIMNRDSFALDYLSGSQMIGILEAARKHTEKKSSWPYDPIEKIESDTKDNELKKQQKSSKTQKEFLNEKDTIQKNIRN